MKVEHHKLFDDAGAPVEFRASPNTAGERLAAPLFLVMHFTAGRGFEQSCDWLCSPKAKASAHIVIGRAGEVAQLVPFDRRAWHAGESRYSYIDGVNRLHHDLTGLNAHSIGIELDNPGPLHRTAIGWSTYWGAIVPIGGDNVILAEHKHGGRAKAWHAYTEAQLLAAYAVCEAIIDAYPSIREVVGHEDIAPQRKTDPGPAFPMDSFRSWLFGRGEG